MNKESEVKRLIVTTVRAAEPTSEIFLFGSRARGDFREDSDWDVLVLIDGDKVASQQFDAINYEVWSRGLEMEEEINVVIRTKKDWRTRTASLFHHNVTAEGIRL